MTMPHFRGGRIYRFGANDTRAATKHLYPSFPQGVALG